ncbi:MAG TPA: murein biosynthesis integral membrane protein MurJ [Ktedonobacteraceae bacterium]|nr:murein biosynthesis integral membrane protein MurJ [Ktedonobacteraceae bacterium]
MSRFLNSDTTGKLQALGYTTSHIVAVRLKSANKYIFRSLLSLASASLFIRLAGMLNQIVVTARFGQGPSMDAYFVASTVPTLMAQLLASGLESSVIPVYARIRTTGSKKEASVLFSTLLNILVIGLLVVTEIMILFRGQIVLLSASGLNEQSRQLAINLTPFIFPVLLFMVINSYLECLLNTEGQFGWPAYAGMLVPITTATLILVAGSSQGVVMLCIGTVMGEILQLGVIIFRASKAGIKYRPVINLRDAALGAVFIAAWPALFGSLISQASPLVDQIFASYLSPGSISTLNYSNKLISVFTGVIIGSVGRAMLPYLSRQAVAKDRRAFKETLRLYLWGVGLATIVLTAFMIVMAAPLVHILFQRGAFTATDTRNTSITLIGFVLGLAPMAIGFILAKAFSAIGRTRILMYVTVFSVFANAFLDYLFSRLWQSFGIALATSVMYVCTMILLLLLLRREVGALDLLTPPREILNFAQRFGLERRYDQLLAWWENNQNGMSFRSQQLLLRSGIILAVFAIGIAGTILNPSLTVKIAFGSLLLLAFLRYRFILLIVWVLIDAYIGSSVPFFNGNNLLSGLTAPTLLLLFYLPLKQAFKRMPALAFFFIFLLWVFLSIGISAIGVSSFLVIWTTQMDFVGVAVLAIFALTTRKRLLLAIDGILLTSMIIALYGIYGYLVKKNGIPDTALPSLFRISSIFSNTPPTLALFLSIVIPLAIYRVTTLAGFRRVIGLSVVLVLLTALGLTFDRGSFISMPISILVMIMLLPSHRMRVAMLGSIAALVAVAALVVIVGNIPIFTRFFSSDITTLNGRTFLWAAILDHFDPTKILGMGLNASDLLLANLQVGNGFGVIATVAHNIYLEILYDHGIIGVTLLLLTLFTMAVSLLRKLRNASADYRMLLAICLAVFINVAMQSFESNDIWNQGVGIYFWIIMALPFALCWTAPAQPAKGEQEAVVTSIDKAEDELAPVEQKLTLPELEAQEV